MEHLTDNQLLDMIDNLTTADEKAAYQVHLSVCGDCMTRYRAFVTMGEQLAALPLMKPSVVFTEKVLEQWDKVRLATVKKKNARLTPFVFLGVVGIPVGIIAVLLAVFSTPAPGLKSLTETVRIIGAISGNESLWTALLLGNILLLLWIINQRVLNPFFRSRMAVQ